jgi:CobQ-like glutamine amidotransferase family enzyme
VAGESQVVIALIRPDALGTYGDGGNAIVLRERLLRRGISARIVAVGVGESVPTQADLCVLGGGEDHAQSALAESPEIGRSLQAAHAHGAVVFGVCAGLQLLGETFPAADGSLLPGYGLLDVRAGGRLDQRAVGELLAESDPSLGLPPLTGFENHRGKTALGPSARPLGRVVHGWGNGIDGLEGAVGERVVGTYLHGPALARNPALADLLLGWVVGELPPLELPQVERLRAERLAAVSGAAKGGRATRR